MSRFSGLFVLALVLGVLSALAAPTPEDIALARKYAPQWRFHKSEVYWPSTVEYFLAGVKQTDAKGNVVNGAVTTSNVDDPANQGSNLYLTADIKAGKAGFLRGQNPSTTATAAYTFIAPKDHGVVDIYYWLFTPFNEGKGVPVVGEVGDHVGDWERMAVRTVNGTATAVDYHAHSDDGSGTIPWAKVVKFDGGQRPVGYVAKGSHGFWATAGTFTYVDAVVFKLQDLTSDGGVYWDIKDSLVAFAYPGTFSGALDWLNYKGLWGNVGETGCWWYVFYKECKIVTGPDGPYRTDVLGAAKVAQGVATPSEDKMKGPLSVRLFGLNQTFSAINRFGQHTLGIASTDTVSSFTFHIDTSGHKVVGYTHLAVQQTCTSTVRPIEDGTQPATSTTSAVTELTDASKFTITPSACRNNFSVTSYTVGACTDSTMTYCSWGSARVLRAYSPDAFVLGIQAPSAIVVTDLDNWRCITLLYAILLIRALAPTTDSQRSTIKPNHLFDKVPVPIQSGDTRQVQLSTFNTVFNYHVNLEPNHPPPQPTSSLHRS
ncbi:hypothetical protein C0991_012234 [Blastosporella zonata]|nr:hypothetical protein C0991_012234 [Blastosporella zonata]